MKKLLSILLALAIVLSIMANPVFAATSVSDFTDQDYLYISIEDYAELRDRSINYQGVAWEEGAQVIYGESSAWGGLYNGTREQLRIASGGGFREDKSVKEITLPQSVVIIGMQAFDSRDHITSVNFEELTNLKYIGLGAFFKTRLETVDLSNTQVVSIDTLAFATSLHCSIRTFTAPATLKRIGKDAFSEQRWLSQIKLNEGLEIIEEGAFRQSSGFIIPSTVREIGKNALNTKTTYRVHKGSYAETWCKENNINYVHVTQSDLNPPKKEVPPTTPVPPATSFPKMEYTQAVGPVTFSNYVSHSTIQKRDASGVFIDAINVKISDKGSMRADRDNTEFIYGSWNAKKEESIIRTDTSMGYSSMGTLPVYKITSYATTKSNGAWSKGLTWQFEYGNIYINDNYYITVEVDGVKHYYYVTVVTDKPKGFVAAPAAPAAPKNATAKPTSSKVYVNGKLVSFDAYNINNNNYFKLRDIAQVIRGTEKQFDVSWDGSKNAINLISKQPYTSTGGELAPGDGKAKNATLSTSSIYMDGSVISPTAYNINGNNYFKLKDLGEAFDFDVSWDAPNNAVRIDTTKGFSAN